MPVNVNLAAVSFQIHNTLKGKSLTAEWSNGGWVPGVDSGHIGHLCFSSLSPSQQTVRVYDIASTDVCALAVLSALLCAIGDDKPIMLPNFLRSGQLLSALS